MEFVKIVNKGTKPFDYHHNNQKVIIPPNGDRIIPWGLACTLFGHPSTLNVHPVNERDKVYAKVRAQFNYTLGILPPEAYEAGIRSSDLWWEHIRPQIEVYNMDTNERIFMVIDDPRGERSSSAPEQVAGTADIAALMQQINRLQSQVTQLTHQQTSQVPDPAAGTTQSPTPTADAAPEPSIDPNELQQAILDASEDVPATVPIAVGAGVPSADPHSTDHVTRLPPRPGKTS